MTQGDHDSRADGQHRERGGDHDDDWAAIPSLGDLAGRDRV
jgi:hypothetical protein